MSERNSGLILPQGRAEDWVYPNGNHGWMGEFSDGSVCNVVSLPSGDKNLVGYIDPSGNKVQPPRERHQLDPRDLMIAIYAAVHQ